jgi:ubiquitin carboxyl-terminal hydrolase L3
MAEKKKAPRWMPLEANPDVMNKYVQAMGMKGTYQFFDVFGLDPELLAMIPQPVVALLLLFPITENNSAYTDQEDEKIKKDGQVVSKDVYFMKQTVGNACGTVGILHSLANNLDKISLGTMHLSCRHFITSRLTWSMKWIAYTLRIYLG